MESDLSLIEISGEDDSLLQQIPSDDNVNINGYLSCSPFQILRSQRNVDRSRFRPSENLKGNEDVRPTCSSPRDSSNKENVNENKFGVPKLSVEPQQMKRRKKGGGYNLRKSLAWDRAFFTEEGVLNPSELSVISGNIDKFSRELCVIDEEGTNSVSGDMDGSNNSSELQALEEKLFKEFPASTSSGGTSIGSHTTRTMPRLDLSTYDNEAPAPAITRKVLSVHDVNRSGSKHGGFPQPSSSSSYPSCSSSVKQAHAIMKVAPREAKLPKIPVSRPDSSLLTTTAKSASLSSSRLKRNHISQPGVTVQKSAGLKVSSSKSKSAQNNAKLGPDSTSLSAKSSVLHATRNMPKLVTKVDSGLEVIPEPALPATRAHPSIAGQNGSVKSAGSLPQHAHCIGRNYAQRQTMKPSGLRMPSPSLGLFSQPKASTSLSQRNAQKWNPLKSNIPNFQKLSTSNPIRELRPPCAPGKTSEVVNDLPTRNITALTSNTYSSAVNPILQDSLKSNLEVDNLHKLEGKFPSKPKRSEVVFDRILDGIEKKSHEHAEPCPIEIPQENSGLQINDSKLLLQSAYCKQESSYLSSHQNPAEMVSVSAIDGMMESQFVGDKKDNISLTHQHDTTRSESRDGFSHSKHGTSKLDDDQLVDMLDAREQSGERVNLITCFSQPDLISVEKNQRLYPKDNTSFEKSSFGESQNYVSENIATPKVQDSITSKSCRHPSQLNNMEKSSKDAIGAVDMTPYKLHAQETLMESLDGDLLVESCKRNLSTCCRYLMIVDDVKLSGNAIPMDFGSSLKVSKDQKTCEVTTLNSIITNVRPESRDSSGTELEEPHSTSQFISAMPVGSVCATEEMTDHQYMEERLRTSPVKNQALITKSQSGDTHDDSRQGSSLVNNMLSCMHDVNKTSGDQAHLIKLCTSEADQILHNENQKLQMEDDNLFKSSQKYDDGCVTDVDPIVRGCSVSEPESFDGQEQSISDSGDLLVESCRTNLSSLAAQNQYIMGSNLINENSGEQTELLNPCLACEQVSEDKPVFCLNDYSFISKLTSASESQEKKASESFDYIVLEQSHPQESGSVISEHPDAEDALPDSGDFNVSREDHVCLTDTQLRHDMELSSQATSLESDSAMKICKEQLTEAVTNCNFQAFHSSSNESGLSLQNLRTSSSESIKDNVGVNEMDSNIVPEKAKSEIYQDSHDASSILRHQLGGALCSTEKDGLMPLKKPENDMKRDAPVIKPPIGAVPFSDEWLTAIEAAGEEILTLKTGAVQNSPTDKSETEPGPWSPVKKKVNQEIGPFDCTKKFPCIPPSHSN